jgi:2-polyprenyl-6-methoxyphenol hydroxylase-like FAD-dependent oxidoreductase
MNETDLHVLVVGGGIGGLCLAQGLKKSGIQVSVYERDESAHFRRQGYRIGINTDGGRALFECLPEDLFNLFLATSCRPIAGRLAVLDSQLNETFSLPLPEPATLAVPFEHVTVTAPLTAVNRLTLREILLAGLDDAVHFGKALEGFEAAAGGARVHFSDGTSAIGTLLVGADGTGSVMRRALLPEATISDVGVAIYGKTPLTAENVEWIPAVFVNGMTRIIGSSGVAMMFGAYQKRQPFAEATARYAPRVSLSDSDDFLMWTVTASLEQMSLGEAEFQQSHPVALHSLAAGLVKDWHALVRRMVSAADISATFPVRLRSANPVASWRTTNVTLLGDAIHTMTPGRGVGANTALRDASLLSSKLVEVQRKALPLIPAVAEYETEMLRYGFDAVARSLSAPFMRLARETPSQSVPPTYPMTRF